MPHCWGNTGQSWIQCYLLVCVWGCGGTCAHTWVTSASSSPRHKLETGSPERCNVCLITWGPGCRCSRNQHLYISIDWRELELPGRGSKVLALDHLNLEQLHPRSPSLRFHLQYYVASWTHWERLSDLGRDVLAGASAPWGGEVGLCEAPKLPAV